MSELIDHKESTEKKSCPVCGKVYGAEERTCPDDGSILAVQDPLVGTILADRYKVLSVLGRGGMSIVYKAKHTLMDRIVAIKLLHASLVSDPASLTRFQREAKAVSALNHPHVILVYDFGVAENGLPFLVMDYLEGQSLSDVLKDQGQIAISRGAGIFIQSAEALQHAHAKGVVHRDLKPSNIMLVNNDGNADYVKLVDFGIAKLLNPGEESQRLTQTGEVVGSPLYMSPEQLMGRALDSRSDIYSMGCVMYESLTGKPPFLGDNIIDTMRKHLDEMPTPLRQVRSDLAIPDELENVIFKALAKIPEQRQQTMADLKQELIQVIGSLAPGAISISTTSPTLQPSSSAPQAVTAKQTLKLPIAPGKQIETTPGILIGVLSSIVILGSIALWVAVAPTGPMQHYLTMTRYKQYDDAMNKFVTEQKFDDAQKMALLAVEQASHLGDKDEKLISSLHDLGVIYRIKQDYPNAQKTFEKMLSIATNAYGKNNIHVADSLDNLAAIDDSRADYKDAEKLYAESLDIKKQLLGMNDAQTAVTLDLMGKHYDISAEYAKAEPLFKQALAIRQKVLGQAAPETTQVLNNLALLYEHQQRYDEAEPLYKQVINTYKQTLGANDPALITPLQDYADLLRKTGRQAEASTLDAQAWKISNGQADGH